VPGLPRIVTKAKGIYKPAESDYALSVRETLAGVYPDRKPVYRHDGTWFYDYFQESEDPNERDNYFTNRGLMRCADDRVPVGVMKQTQPKPNVRYQILGLALVSGWRDGWFRLEGFGPGGVCHTTEPGGALASEEILSNLVDEGRGAAGAS